MLYHRDENWFLPVYHALTRDTAPAPVYRVYHGWTVRPSEDIVDDKADCYKVPPVSIHPAGDYYYFSLEDALEHFHEIHDFYIDVADAVEEMWYEFNMNPLNIKAKLESLGRFYKLYYRREWETSQTDEPDRKVHHLIRLSISRMNVCLPGDRTQYMHEMDFASNYPEGF